MNKEVENELKKLRVDFVHFVDISKLTNKQNRGLPCAILIGIAINPKFVKDVFNNPDYKPLKLSIKDLEREIKEKNDLETLKIIEKA